MEVIKKLKDKRGISTIEVIIGFLIMVILICFITDIIGITYKHFKVAQLSTKVIRKLSIQGGVRISSPVGFIGGDKNYLTYSELKDKVSSELNSAGINEDEWTMSIEGQDIKTNSQLKIIMPNTSQGGYNLEVDYKDGINLEIRYKYKWELISQIIPQLKNGNGVSRRYAVSNFKYDYDVWEEEQ